MGKTKKHKALKGGTAYELDRHRRIVRELPDRMEKRHKSIAARHDMLHAAEALSARLEHDRMSNHLTRMGPGLQRAAVELHMGTLSQKIHHLAQKGLP